MSNNGGVTAGKVSQRPKKTINDIRFLVQELTKWESFRAILSLPRTRLKKPELLFCQIHNVSLHWSCIGGQLQPGVYAVPFVRGGGDGRPPVREDSGRRPDLHQLPPLAPPLLGPGLALPRRPVLRPAQRPRDPDPRRDQEGGPQIPRHRLHTVRRVVLRRRNHRLLGSVRKNYL